MFPLKPGVIKHYWSQLLCVQVAILGQSDEDTAQIAREYGKNIGIAFQLVDDLLDFTSTEEMMGKPTAADLKLGLATAPVLFAAQEVRSEWYAVESLKLFAAL